MKHGHASRAGRSPTYEAWANMMRRCANIRDPRYGGRGIGVCERWHEFANFLADMGDKPAGLELDRIDNDGNYEPSNCRWTTRVTQVRNRSCVKLTAVVAQRIRSETNASAREVGAKYGISPQLARQVQKGLIWK